MARNEDTIDTMKSFFGGKIKNEAPKSPRLVELGHGKGIGHVRGTYNEYIEKLSEQKVKGNGLISIGKAVIEKDVFSMPNPTDKFTLGDIPKLLITYGSIINGIQLKVSWKDSSNDIILEQFYNIPSPYSMGNDWWDSYGILFLGPDLEEGNYKVEIISEEIISREYTIGEKRDNIKTLKASLEFSVEAKDESDKSDKSEK